MARRTVSGPLTRRTVAKARLRAVTPQDPYGLADVTAKDLEAELKRRRGGVNANGKARQYRETPELIAAIVRMTRAAGLRVGPGMDIDALDQLAALRDEVQRVIGDAARELTRPNLPHGHDPDQECVRDGDSPCPGDSPNRRRYSWTRVATALGLKDRQTAHDRYANPDGPRKPAGNPARPRRKP